MYIRDTIAAVSTPPGNGGIGIVRISGSKAAVISDAIFKRANSGGLKSHRFYFGMVQDPETGTSVDEAMAVLMLAPRSYTREDVLELHCHGGTLVVDRVLALCLRLGARLADPGEFTRRAFLNGRIDLLQAEAVMDIIGSQTDAALHQAQCQREGLLSLRIEKVRGHLLKALALVEAYIDFPEEDLGDADVAGLVSLVGAAQTDVCALLASFDEGRRLREGIAVLIIGKPNVGKSSLLNRLLDENRAIVTHLPGTTRDIIEETINLGGLPVRLLDTAGIRHTDCLVEQEGIKRALDMVPKADLILFVLDASRPFDEEDQLIKEAISGTKTIVVSNKCDLPSLLELPPDLASISSVSISSLTAEGVLFLKETVRTAFLKNAAVDSREFVAISHARHRDALAEAAIHLERTLEGLGYHPELELLAVDLRETLSAIGSVTGQVTTDEVLDIVFSSFCIGK